MIKRAIIAILLVIIILGCASTNKKSRLEFTRLGFGYSQKKNMIYFRKRNRVPGGLSSTIYFPELIEVHAKSFEILNNYFARDKYNIYYCGKKIVNADPESFQLLNIPNPLPNFNRISLNDTFWCNENTILINSDYYAKDSKHTYYGSKVIEEADPNSFHLLSILYSVDCNNAYYKKDRIVHADPESFQVIAGNLAKDKTNIYFAGNVISKNNESFRLLNAHYFRDKSNIYYTHCLLSRMLMVDTLKTLDPLKFEILGDTFGKYENHVYYKSKTIKEADANTFTVLSSLYSKDSANVYFEDKVIEDVDCETFQLLCHTWGKDKNWIIRRGEIRKFVDYDSFEITLGGWAKDKDTHIEKVRLIK